jgi:hypothetical protein
MTVHWLMLSPFGFSRLLKAYLYGYLSVVSPKILTLFWTLIRRKAGVVDALRKVSIASLLRESRFHAPAQATIPAPHPSLSVACMEFLLSLKLGRWSIVVL